MRYHRYFYGYGFISVFAAVAVALIDFARAVFLYAAEHTWHSLRMAGVTAYRKIADLKPVYRDSYATHGLSLSDGRAA